MVYIFKTSVASQMNAKTLNKHLEKIKEIKQWNFDLEDCDNILRIVADKLDTTNVINLLTALGFDCKELD